MALRHETKVEKRTFENPQTHEKLERSVEVDEIVFDLVCSCGKKGGEFRFPVNHGRESDDHLEKELLEKYSHTCEDHTP